MKSKYYWLMGLGGAASVVLVSGLAMANFDKSPHRGNGGDHGASFKHEKGEEDQKHRRGFKSLFHAIDSNQDRQISLEEVNNMLKSRFASLDDDGNGQISLEEFSNRHLSMFEAVDANRDGLITRDEMKKHRHERQHERSEHQENHRS